MTTPTCARRTQSAGGTISDFFEGRDAAFVQHRNDLLARLGEIAELLSSSPYGPLGIISAWRMRMEAIAKSYRPNKATFLADQFPCVGAGAPGELFFRAPLVHFDRLRRRAIRN